MSDRRNHDNRDRVLELYKSSRSNGIVQGANEMFQILSPELPEKYRRKALMAYLRIYDQYRVGGTGGRLS